MPFVSGLCGEGRVEVDRLQAAGAIVVGKTNVPVFGSAATCKNLPFGATCNPWNSQRTSGGSSGGSAAAVAARMVPLATAADSGGSIRIPAAFCGVFGLKPSFGRIPEEEGSAFAFTKWMRTTHYGPICRSVRDAALYLDVTAGHHPVDALSLPVSPPGCPSFVAQAVAPQPRPLRIAFSASLGYVRAVQSDVLAAAHEAVGALRTAGHEVLLEGEPGGVAVALPDLGLQWGLAMGAQTYAMLGGKLAGREGAVERGFVGGWPMLRAQSVDDLGEVHRSLFALQRALATLFAPESEGGAGIDLIATPAMPTDPFPAEGPMATEVPGYGPMDSPMHAVGFMYPFNFSGHPACVLRCSRRSDAGLPAALQLVAPPHQDGLLLRIAAQYEKITACYGSWPDEQHQRDIAKL